MVRRCGGGAASAAGGRWAAGGAGGKGWGEEEGVWGEVVYSFLLFAKFNKFTCKKNMLIDK